MQTCPACWSPINWCESFAKFGHDDGEDCVHTFNVGNFIEKVGYHVEVLSVSTHNPIVLVLSKLDDEHKLVVTYGDNIPEGNQLGYSNPRENLPPALVTLLDQEFGTGEWFD